MSKTSFVVGMTIAGAVGSSFVGAFKTADRRLEDLAGRQEKINKKLKAAGDVVKYGRAVERLTARQQSMGRSNARLDRVLGEVTRRYKAATREARSYGIEVGQVAREQRRLQRDLKTTQRMQRGLRLRQQAGGFLREGRARMLGAGAAAYGGARLIGRAMEREEQGLFLGTVINAPDRDAAVGRARAHARQQARTTLASESEMLQIEYSLNSAGLQEEVARAGSGIVHRVATVTRGSAQQVGAIMGVAFNNLAGGMEGTAEEKLRRIGDVLAKTQFMFQIEDFSGLGEGLKHGAKAAVNYKVSLEQAAAALGVLNSAGLQGSMAGTAFAATLRSLGKAAEEYGTELVRDEKGQLDLIATIGQLRDALADLDVDERAAELQRMFGDEGLAGISPLMEQLSQLGAGFDAVSEAARRGLVNAEYKRFLESTTGQWKIFGNNVALVGETFAGTLLPPLNAVLGPMSTAAVWVGSLIERFPALGYAVGGVVVGLTGLVAVSAAAAGAAWLYGAALAVIPSRLAIAAAATKAWTAVMWLGRTAALAFNVALLANPITWVVGALAGAAYLVYRYWDPIKEFFADLWEGIKGGVSKLGDVVRQVGTVIVEALAKPREAVDAVVGTVGKVFDWLGLGGEDAAPEATSRSRPRRAGVGATVAAGMAVVAAPAPAATAPDLSPPPAVVAAPPAPARGPTTITVTVGDIVIEAPAGADPEAIAALVRREMAAIMREGAIEAGLTEADDAY